jgi:hypothetical protein
MGDLRAACDEADQPAGKAQGTLWGKVQKLLSPEALAQLEAAAPPPPQPSEAEAAAESAELQEALLGAKLSQGAIKAIVQSGGVTSMKQLLGEDEATLIARVKLKLGDKKRLQELLSSARSGKQEI